MLQRVGEDERREFADFSEVETEIQQLMKGDYPTFMIKEIKEQTNTKINVYPECLTNSNERVVALGGENEEVVVKGMEFVLGILDSAPRRSATVFFRPDQLEGKQLSIPDISGKLYFEVPIMVQRV